MLLSNDLPCLVAVDSVLEYPKEIPINDVTDRESKSKVMISATN